MNKGDLVTLEDNENYLLLMDTQLEGKKFWYANKVDDESNTTSEYEFFEEVKEGSDTYLDTVEEEQLRHLLTLVFSADLVDFASDVENGLVDYQ